MTRPMSLAGGISLVLALTGCGALPTSQGNGAAANGLGDFTNSASGATTGTQSPPAVTAAYLIGTWSLGGDCSHATTFGRDGHFMTTDGILGTWVLNGERLSMQGQNASVARIVAIDQNSLDMVREDGTPGRFLRCFGGHRVDSSGVTPPPSTPAPAGSSSSIPTDAQLRSDAREIFVQQCSAAFRARPAEPGIDFNRLCSCSIDRWMQGRSTSDMQRFTPGDPAFADAERQCAAEQLH